MTQTTTRTEVSEAEAADRVAFADGVLGAAGHEVTDPQLREIGRRFAREEISIEEAMALSDQVIFGRS